MCNILRSGTHMHIDEVVDRVRAFPDLRPEEKRGVISELVTVHPLVNLNWGSGWLYRRARELTPTDRIENVRDVIWREGIPTRVGRANAEGYPIMYAADRRDTALREIHLEDGRVAVSQFTIRPGRQIRLYPVGELIHAQRTGAGFLSGGASGGLHDFLNSGDRSSARATLIVDAFLLDCLTSHDDYQITSHVALSVFEKLPFITAISYPSRQQYGALCFAVKTPTFWENWGLHSVTIGNARHLAQGVYDFRATQGVSGITNDGDFRWDHDLRQDEIIGNDPLWFPPE